MTPGSIPGMARHGAGDGTWAGTTHGIHGAGVGDPHGARHGAGDLPGAGDPAGAEAAGIPHPVRRGTTATGRLTTPACQALTVRRTVPEWLLQPAAVRAP